MLIKVFAISISKQKILAEAAGTQVEQNHKSWIQGYLFVSWSD